MKRVNYLVAIMLIDLLENWHWYKISSAGMITLAADRCFKSCFLNRTGPSRYAGHNPKHLSGNPC